MLSPFNQMQLQDKKKFGENWHVKLETYLGHQRDIV